MMRIKIFCGLFSCFLLISSYAFPSDEGTVKLFPFPLAEAQKVLSHWLADAGYEVSRSGQESGEIHVMARKNHESWQMILKPHSPLQTEIMLKRGIEAGGQSDTGSFEGLWTYLERYAEGLRLEPPGRTQSIPPPVMQHSQSVVCIETGPQKGAIQLSGFFFDETGLIMTTAHDLKESYPLMVVLNDGSRYGGHVIKTDHHRDLALIKATFRPSTFVPLARGRVQLDPGEKIFTIGCPQSSVGVTYAGTVSGPPRLADDLPLWQVALRVLPGSSGSPVFDAQGKLVAIVKGRYRGTDSVGFLIPLSTVMEFLGR